MKGTRRVSLIAAVAENGVIGRKGALPWRIPEDFRFYLDKVRDQIIILGRHCFYEADHPAALTIALSRNPQWQPPPLKVPSIHISHIIFVLFTFLGVYVVRPFLRAEGGGAWWPDRCLKRCSSRRTSVLVQSRTRVQVPRNAIVG